MNIYLFTSFESYLSSYWGTTVDYIILFSFVFMGTAITLPLVDLHKASKAVLFQADFKRLIFMFLSMDPLELIFA